MKASSNTPRPCFESLEPRVLLDGAVNVYVSDGDLHIVGDAADNNVILTGLGDGGYRVTGVPSMGRATTINGGIFTDYGNVSGAIEVDLGGGDDILNVGALSLVDTTIDTILFARLGTGTNTLNIGRIRNGDSLSYAGQVTIEGSVIFTNGVWGHR